MATSSFTLKQSVAGGGSYLQSSGAEDGALKSDGFVSATSVASLQSSFTANVYKRTEVELEWELDTALTTPTVGSSTYVPVELMIKVSQYGDPVTPGDGGLSNVLATYTSTNYKSSLIDTVRPLTTVTDPVTNQTVTIDQNYIKPGNWLYYSLFIKYQNGNGDSYYDRVAVVSVQIPRDFGSTEDLWRHVPEYYKQLDNEYKLNTDGYVTPEEGTETNGPLYRFVELFGWELDKIRTTIYDTMRINDPEVIHSSAIDALAKQVGVDLSKDDLGTAKLRTILNNIGKIQRTKGTIDSIEAYITALSGCNLSTDTSTKPVKFNVYPQRINFVTDPYFKQGSIVSDTTGPIYRKYTNLSSGGPNNGAHGWGVYLNAPSVTGTPAIEIVNNKLVIYLPPSAVQKDLYIYSRGSIPYNNNVPYYGSYETSNPSYDFNLRFVQASVLSTTLEAAGGSENVIFFDTWNNSAASSAFPRSTYTTSTGAARKVVGSIANTSTQATANVVPVFYFPITNATGASFTFANPMVEPRNTVAEFFTGDTSPGGFIPTATNVSTGAFDYKWGPSDAGTANASFSYYTTDDHRSRKITEYIVDNYVAPVTFMKTFHYVINWDVIE